MTTVFLVCAAVGGTILVAQFALMLIGLGGEAMDVDLPTDLHGDLSGGLDGGLDGGIGGHFDAGHDVAADHHVGSTWLFGVLSFRTVVAALAFFGLAGLTARSFGMKPFSQLGVAALAGLAAMYGVYFLMLNLSKLKSEGTPQIHRAVGKHGTVYITIPGEVSGTGKIQLNLQNRTMEYLAQTSGHALSPGARVVVTDVVTSNTLQVEPILENEERNEDA
jgi:hypothetical protein